ncbi:MAG TPA: hypothetical protein VMX55_06150 [candidate division Zixibacteria bacterium]|nr:hypothetical protein [candidate division Zixibacteria bacterium]
MEKNTSDTKIKLKFVFYLEGLINSTIVIICLFFPNFFLKQVTSSIPSSIIAIEMVRWYSILLFVITFILMGALIIEKYEFFKIILIGYLIGDFIQIAATIYLAIRLASWTFALIFTIAITIILVIFRILILLKPNLLGFR